MGNDSNTYVRIRAVWQPKVPEDYDEQCITDIYTFLNSSNNITGPTFILHKGYEEDENGDNKSSSWYGMLDYSKQKFDFGTQFTDPVDRYMPTNLTIKQVGVGEIFNLTDGGEESVFKITNVKTLAIPPP